MSVKVMQLIWERAPYVEHGLILVLLALADWANDEGFCWPSMDLLAEKSRQSRRNISYVLKRLEDDEVIDLQRGNGRGHATHYRINIERMQRMQPLQSLKDAKDATTATFTTPQRLQRMQPLPIKDATTSRPTIKDARADPSVDPSVKEVDVKVGPTIVQSRKSKKLPTSQEPGELHPTVIDAVESMVVRKFHCLAQPTKQNEDFWDSQIAYVDEARIISLTRCLKEVDAYWSGNPRKLALKPDGLRRQMHRGIEIAIEKAQRNMKGQPHHG
jgi:hypothetical protein